MKYALLIYADQTAWESMTAEESAEARAASLPRWYSFFEELGNVHGAFGAKGIGELPMDGPAPAIVNAIEDALKVPFDSIPLLPEDVFAGLTAKQPQSTAGAR